VYVVSSNADGKLSVNVSVRVVPNDERSSVDTYVQENVISVFVELYDQAWVHSYPMCGDVKPGYRYSMWMYSQMRKILDRLLYETYVPSDGETDRGIYEVPWYVLFPWDLIPANTMALLGSVLTTPEYWTRRSRWWPILHQIPCRSYVVCQFIETHCEDTLARLDTAWVTPTILSFLFTDRYREHLNAWPLYRENAIATHAVVPVCNLLAKDITRVIWFPLDTPNLESCMHFALQSMYRQADDPDSLLQKLDKVARTLPASHQSILGRWSMSVFMKYINELPMHVLKQDVIRSPIERIRDVWQMHPSLLAHIPSKILSLVLADLSDDDRKLYFMLSIDADPANLSHIPVAYRTRPICRRALAADATQLVHVPEKTEEPWKLVRRALVGWSGDVTLPLPKYITLEDVIAAIHKDTHSMLSTNPAVAFLLPPAQLTPLQVRRAIAKSMKGWARVWASQTTLKTLFPLEMNYLWLCKQDVDIALPQLTLTAKQALHVLKAFRLFRARVRPPEGKDDDTVCVFNLRRWFQTYLVPATQAALAPIAIATPCWVDKAYAHALETLDDEQRRRVYAVRLHFETALHHSPLSIKLLPAGWAWLSTTTEPPARFVDTQSVRSALLADLAIASDETDHVLRWWVRTIGSVTMPSPVPVRIRL